MVQQDVRTVELVPFCPLEADAEGVQRQGQSPQVAQTGKKGGRIEGSFEREATTNPTRTEEVEEGDADILKAMAAELPPPEGAWHPRDHGSECTRPRSAGPWLDLD